MAESAPTLIQSVQRALHLVEAVSARQGRARAKELARDLGLCLPTTYHLLRTLTHEGYLKRLDDGSYVIGPALLQVATQDRMVATLTRARPAMQGLRDELRSPVYLAAYVDGEINVVEIVDSAKAPSIDLWVGMHDSAHATALGKCILSALDDSAREDYLARHPLHALTRRTVTNRSVLESEISRALPIARDQEEYALGVQCMAAPVVTTGFLGAVAVARGPEQAPAAKETVIASALTRAAQRIQRSMALAE
jgi:IclR family transcriptional regulator, acetate operon repressor